ncbi:hypothetical protein SAMN05421823_10581 [Catalinimonas alkaloidigena]|uniref:AB hydrolase-1 domain-containing protein n=1 Tax=Catalinimonas alkaloidigena TaxID=1075417 RepID=A0A1G9IR73_9BACT|nr:alpha/beta fold hydrolase [Catalinimonas alkaloidigena]SDL27621.1 hypothetical protein SAMN05421823_10581 [Catalinimonas alkaloidigena]
MPLVASPYRAPRLLFNGHLQTIAPHLWRRQPPVAYRRERLELPDGDFLDLDWVDAAVDQNRLVVLSHGLEGDSSRAYMVGMAHAFAAQGWHVLAWNCRTCSGVMNRLPRFYHHGDADDLAAVVQHALAPGKYRQLVLIGFSMGGSMTLKYLGRTAAPVPEAVQGAVVFSVPCDLYSSIVRLHHPHNVLYRRRFLQKLKQKMVRKALQFPDQVNIRNLDLIQDFPSFIERFMGPLHGYRDLARFYHEASAVHYLAGIRRPTLLVNAQNDPMLAGKCFPVAEARDHTFLHLEMPLTGGHVGFTRYGFRLNWAEQRALEFVESLGLTS